MKTKTINLILIWFYLGVAISTFGHAWNRQWPQAVIDSGGQIIVSTGSAIVWPLYWSTVIWEKKTP